MNGLKKRTVKGIGWAMSSQLLKVVLALAISSILAHLLHPEDFGLIAMAMVFINLVGLLNDMGLQSALIQKKEGGDAYASSAFWLNLAEGVLLSLAVAALAPAIARFYGESRLSPMIMAISPTFAVTSLGMIQGALLQKKLEFRMLAVADVLSVLAAGGAAVALAYGGAGAWSLVAQALVAAAIYTCIVFAASGWKPSMRFAWKPAGELLGYGLPLMGSSFVNYFNRNLDNMLIGKFLGGEQLGYYSLAYKLLLFPLQNVSSTLGRVMFPALALIQEDHAKVRDAYLKATRYIAAVTFPMMAGLALTAPQFVRVVFGPQWERSVFLVQVLAGVGLIQSIGTTVGWIYLSQGRTDILFKWNLFALAVASASFALGLLWDIEGVACSYATASLLLAYPLFAIPFRLIGLRFKSFWGNLGRAAACTAMMGAVVWGTGIMLEKVFGLGDAASLAVMISVGAASYAGSLFVADRETLRELRALVGELRGRGGGKDGSMESES
jgi:PST family polysaccharide transporter